MPQPLVCGSCQDIVDDREVEAGKLGAEQGVEPLYPTSADEFYISEHLAVFIPDVLRAA